MLKNFNILLTSLILFAPGIYSSDLKALECREGKPEVFFISPSENIVSSTGVIDLEFGIKNFNIAPAGHIACDSGHHHLLINVPLPDLTRPIPSDENHIHYGKGQTSDTINLPKGVHKLRLVLGNFAHIPHDAPIISDELIVEVR